MSALIREATVEQLASASLFRNCSRSQLEDVARLAERVRVGRNEVLAGEGCMERACFLILSGTVTVTRGQRHVNTLGPGDFFGELAAIDPGPRNATVTALSESDLLMIGPRQFVALSEIPGFRDALLKSMTNRLRAKSAPPERVAEESRPAFVPAMAGSS